MLVSDCYEDATTFNVSIDSGSCISDLALLPIGQVRPLFFAFYLDY